MFSSKVALDLETIGHDAFSVVAQDPRARDGALVAKATAENRVLVTENFQDFAFVTECCVLFVRKSWWPAGSFDLRLAHAIGKWADANPAPGPYARWLEAEFR